MNISIKKACKKSWLVEQAYNNQKKDFMVILIPTIQ